MKRLTCLLLVPLLLAACDIPDNPTRQGPSGPEIALRDGQNCYDARCFDFDAGDNTVSVQARRAVPAGSVGDYVSPATFTALFQAALRAPERVNRGGASPF